MAEKKNIFSRKMAWRFFRTLWGFYPRLLPGILVLIFINAGILSLPAVFMQKVVAVLEKPGPRIFPGPPSGRKSTGMCGSWPCCTWYPWPPM